MILETGTQENVEEEYDEEEEAYNLKLSALVDNKVPA